MERFKTYQLLEELKKREAVAHINIEPYKKIELLIDNKKQDLPIKEGPANILIIWD